MSMPPLGQPPYCLILLGLIMSDLVQGALICHGKEEEHKTYFYGCRRGNGLWLTFFLNQDFG